MILENKMVALGQGGIRRIPYLGLNLLLSLVGTRAIRRLEFSQGIAPSSSRGRTNYTQHGQSTIARRSSVVVVDIPSSPDGHLVTDPLPLTKDGEELTVKHWAGHLPANELNTKYFFYWLFEPETVTDTTPILIWLNGGPGCSSMEGLFLENGPIQWTVVDGTFQLQKNPFSWHLAPAYTLYIDQPVGTGLSFTTSKGYPRNDLEVNIDFFYFLTSFFDFHADKFVKDGSVWRKLFFSGESHAGHYIPSMMNYILKQNKNGGKVTIPLAGAAIGNGWMDPIYQYAAAEAAYGRGLLGLAQVNAMAQDEKKCQDLLRKGNYQASTCFNLLNNIAYQAFGSQSQYRVSQYDVRISESKDTDRRFPFNHEATECYLGGINIPNWSPGKMRCGAAKNSVLNILHAAAATTAGQKYEECTDPPYDALSHQDGKGVVDDIVAVLEHPSKPRMLFFNGIEDLVCNHVGNEKALENLPWHGKEKWTLQHRYAWFPGTATQPAGFMKEYENLSFLKLLNAGHMVPSDVPDIALEMIKIFTTEGSFSDSIQDMDSSVKAPPAACPICSTCPAQEECPKCFDDDVVHHAPSEQGVVKNCSVEIAQAKQETLDESISTKVAVTSGISFTWAIPMVVLLILLVGIIQCRQRREGRDLVLADLEEEDEPEFRDEPELDGKRNGGSFS